jgi:hypothetical protein
MPYYITGTLTFNSANNRNSAVNAMEAVPVGSAVPWDGGPYPAGISTSGSTVATVSFVIDDEAEARTFTRALFDSYRANARNAGHLGVVKAPD